MPARLGYCLHAFAWADWHLTSSESAQLSGRTPGLFINTAVPKLPPHKIYCVYFAGTPVVPLPGAQKGRIAVWTHEVRPKGEGHGCPESIITAIYE